MKYLKNNQRLKIVPDDASGVLTGVIKSMSPVSFVVAVESPDSPMLKQGEVFEIVISDETCILSFETKITEIKDSLVCFSMPENFRLVQRREYPRVDISIPVSIKELSTENGVEFLGTTSNISGGGLKVTAPGVVNPGMLVETQFKILNVKNIKTILEVLRTEHPDGGSDFFVSGKFKEISNADRIALIQLCFKRQLELKCKGVGR